MSYELSVYEIIPKLRDALSVLHERTFKHFEIILFQSGAYASIACDNTENAFRNNYPKLFRNDVYGSLILSVCPRYTHNFSREWTTFRRNISQYLSVRPRSMKI